MVAEYNHQFVRIVPGEVPEHGLFGYCSDIGHGVESVCIASIDGDRAVIEAIEDGDGERGPIEVPLESVSLVPFDTVENVVMDAMSMEPGPYCELYFGMADSAGFKEAQSKAMADHLIARVRSIHEGPVCF